MLTKNYQTAVNKYKDKSIAISGLCKMQSIINSGMKKYGVDIAAQGSLACKTKCIEMLITN
jgi:hypothetical protein